MVMQWVKPYYSLIINKHWFKPELFQAELLSVLSFTCSPYILASFLLALQFPHSSKKHASSWISGPLGVDVCVHGPL